MVPSGTASPLVEIVVVENHICVEFFNQTNAIYLSCVELRVFFLQFNHLVYRAEVLGPTWDLFVSDIQSLRIWFWFFGAEHQLFCLEICRLGVWAERRQVRDSFVNFSLALRFFRGKIFFIVIVIRRFIWRVICDGVGRPRRGIIFWKASLSLPLLTLFFYLPVALLDQLHHWLAI